MASVEDVEQSLKPIPLVDGEYEEEQIDDDEQAYLDVQEAIRLLKKAKTLLDFLGDGDMIKAISNKERKVINTISGMVGDFVQMVEPVYAEDEGGGE